VLVKPPDNPPEVMRDLLELTHHKAVEMGEQTGVEPRVRDQRVREGHVVIKKLRQYCALGIPKQQQNWDTASCRRNELGRGVKVVRQPNGLVLAELECPDGKRVRGPEIPVNDQLCLGPNNLWAVTPVLVTGEWQVQGWMLKDLRTHAVPGTAHR
jgi:hypothetical protein